jgi:hypothetical protein
MSRYLIPSTTRASYWTDRMEQFLLYHISQIDTNDPNPDLMDAHLIPQILAARKIQKISRGILTRRIVHIAMLSTDPDEFSNAVLRCSSRKRKRC